MLVLPMGFVLMIKRELAHQFLMGLRVFEVVGEKSALLYLALYKS